eukprot:scaffold217997_cov31-Tisochrysis_lutea.AAC.3
MCVLSSGNRCAEAVRGGEPATTCRGAECNLAASRPPVQLQCYGASHHRHRHPRWRDRQEEFDNRSCSPDEYLCARLAAQNGCL